MDITTLDVLTAYPCLEYYIAGLWKSKGVFRYAYTIFII